MPSRDRAAGNNRGRRWAHTVVAALAVVLGLARLGDAAIVECASGDVACLISAIIAANANGEINTIRLQAGTYTLTAVDNVTDESNGLPLITSSLTIVGAGVANTIIERDATGPSFRLFHVGQTGVLKLQSLTARGGSLGEAFLQRGGGGLLNLGSAIIIESAVTENAERGLGGGIGAGGIDNSGRLVIAGSTISRNTARGPGGGVASFAGLLTVLNSTISGNDGNLGGGLFIGDASMAIIVGSTIADNRATDGSGGGIFSSSTAVGIVNSTLAGNRTNFGGGGLAGGGGIVVNATIANNDGGFSGDALFASNALALHNAIVAGSLVPFGPPVCVGPVTSLGNNLFTAPACAVALLADDRTGDPRLGDFTDDGTPGHGFLPLLRRSPALNAGDDAACLPADQRGRRRNAKGC